MKRQRPPVVFAGRSFLMLPYGDFSRARIKIQSAAIEERGGQVLPAEFKSSDLVGKRLIVVTSPEGGDAVERVKMLLEPLEIVLGPGYAFESVIAAIVTADWIQFHLKPGTSSLNTSLDSTLFMSKSFDVSTCDTIDVASAPKKSRVEESEVIIVDDEEVVVVKADESTTVVAAAASNMISESTEKHGTMMAFLRMSAEKRKPTTATIVASEQGSKDKCLVLSVPATALENVVMPNDKWLSVCPEAGVTEAAFKQRFQHGACGVPGNQRAEQYAAMTPCAFGLCQVFVAVKSVAASKILALDMDGTLIKATGGGKKGFCSTADDWAPAFANVYAKLRSMYVEGYRIVVFSNQNGVAKGHTTLEIVRARFEKFAAAAGIPMTMFFATHDDFFRKPRVGMWYLFSSKCNGGVPVNFSSSLYVGDAAGRPKTSLTPRDHSASDLQFALNSGLRFATPEAFFLGSTQTIHSNPLSVADLGFIPLSLPLPGSPVITSKEPVVLESDLQEIALLVGPPGTGKSSFAVNSLPHHARINQDKLKNKARCLSEATSELADKRSVVIDATNIDVQVRADWINLAARHRVRIRAFVFDVPKPIPMHLNTVRSVNPLGGVDGPDDKRAVPDMVIHAMYKRFEAPTRAEGFSEVIQARCVPGPFEEDPSSPLFAADQFAKFLTYSFV